MKKISQAASASLMAILLSACGGGGSSSATVALDLPVKNLFVDEGKSTTFTIHTTPGASVSVQGGTFASVQKMDGYFEVSAAEVDRTITETFTISASLKDAKTNQKQLTVVINNLSGASTEEAVEATLANEESLLMLEEDFALYRAIVETMYLQDAISDSSSSVLTSPMSYSEKQNMIASFNPSSSWFYSMLRQSIDELDQTFVDYSKGQVSELELQDALANAQNILLSHGQYGAEKLNPLFQALYPDVDLEGQTDLEFSSEAGRYSRFVGDSDFGQFDGTTWTFTNEYSLLETIVPTHNNNIGFCEA